MEHTQLLHKPGQKAVFPHNDNSSFCVISTGGRVAIPFDAIIHISKQADDSTIYTAAKNYKTRHSLTEILDALPSIGFYRVHRAHIVAFEHVKEIQSDCVFINGHYLPMSVYYKAELNKKLQSLLNENYNFYFPV